ncbi:MAG: CidA/LrgA family protein [Agathobacter sp.]|nr:CidA/LrgA family protein [Agathobacter sp.]
MIVSFGILFLISVIGEILHEVIPLPVPASVYGLLILFAALVLKWIKLDWVETGADILVTIMPLLFVPSVVKIVTLQELIMDNLIAILVVIVCSSIVVMVVTGKVAQKMIEKMEKKDAS